MSVLQPTLEALLLIGGVEPNPGPIAEPCVRCGVSLDEREQIVDEWEKELDALERMLDDRERQADQLEKELAEREEAMRQHEAGLDLREEAVRRREMALKKSSDRRG